MSGGRLETGCQKPEELRKVYRKENEKKAEISKPDQLKLIAESLDPILIRR